MTLQVGDKVIWFPDGAGGGTVIPLPPAIVGQKAISIYVAGSDVPIILPLPSLEIGDLGFMIPQWNFDGWNFNFQPFPLLSLGLIPARALIINADQLTGGGTVFQRYGSGATSYLWMLSSDCHCEYSPAVPFRFVAIETYNSDFNDGSAHFYIGGSFIGEKDTNRVGSVWYVHDCVSLMPAGTELRITSPDANAYVPPPFGAGHVHLFKFAFWV